MNSIFPFTSVFVHVWIFIINNVHLRLRNQQKYSLFTAYVEALYFFEFNYFSNINGLVSFMAFISFYPLHCGNCETIKKQKFMTDMLHLILPNLSRFLLVNLLICKKIIIFLNFLDLEGLNLHTRSLLIMNE